MEMTKGWAELECAQYIRYWTRGRTMQMYVWEPLVRGLQANTGWKEVKEVKEGNERNMQENEMTWKKHDETWTEPKEYYRELHGNTHTQTNRKWKEQWQEWKQNGREKTMQVKWQRTKETWKGHERELFAWEMERHVQSWKVW